MVSGLSLARITVHSPHVATLAGWAHEAWGHLHPGRGRAAAIASLRAECGASGVPSVFAAMEDERPVGMASLVVDDMNDRASLTPWLASVYVLPEWRGRGVATALVRRVEDEARDHGHGLFYLYTPDQQSLYRRLGWQAVEEREYHGETVTIMRRTLTPAD
ncbi:GNAT family N-acetyltransferase [Halomonas borealis]|uniref:GNAT family N-acetyltransferase n=1 Tax=Halomonas borealis TaxID=2508710 RepID=UPI00109FA641|nr:GNAT family N-acetyltransferase [Halomonas borealis]